MSSWPEPLGPAFLSCRRSPTGVENPGVGAPHSLSLSSIALPLFVSHGGIARSGRGTSIGTVTPRFVRTGASVIPPRGQAAAVRRNTTTEEVDPNFDVEPCETPIRHRRGSLSSHSQYDVFACNSSPRELTEKFRPLLFDDHLEFAGCLRPSVLKLALMINEM